MKILKMIYSVVLHGFLGYVWIVFINSMLDMFHSGGKSVLSGLLVGAGTLLFLDVTSRVFDSFEKDKKHPVRIAGYVSFGLVVMGFLLGAKA
ncbi:MAG TPA: hypothetical protein VIG80_16115 [Bacillaceae bacterium]